MRLALCSRGFALSAKSGFYSENYLIQYPITLNVSSFKSSNLSIKPAVKSQCIKHKVDDKSTEGFSVLSSDVPWETRSIWSTMALYMFNLHIPLGVGGLSIVAYVLHQPVLDPQTEAVSLLLIQILELIGALLLLRSSARPEYKEVSLLNFNLSLKKRNWLLASVLGLGILVMLLLLTSALSDFLFGAKATDNSVLKEMLLSSNLSKEACVLVYSFVTPVLEEIVYRGFLLTSLASSMNWKHAVFLSSAVFSAAHFSVENFLQLFIIGCVLGCCYSWTGNLTSSILVHSLYNTIILIITFVS